LPCAHSASLPTCPSHGQAATAAAVPGDGALAAQPEACDDGGSGGSGGANTPTASASAAVAVLRGMRGGGGGAPKLPRWVGEWAAPAARHAARVAAFNTFLALTFVLFFSPWFRFGYHHEVGARDAGPPPPPPSPLALHLPLTPTLNPKTLKP
jgi:hypothetical protein